MTNNNNHGAGKLVLVDAYSLLFRAHFANPYLSALDGRPTGALFGFSGMLLTILKSHKPQAVVVCWDAPEQTIREKEYEAYKAHRPEVDPALKAQMPEARKLVASFGIQSAELGGYEADDLIGTLAAEGRKGGFEVVIVTGDSDQLQLVQEGVTVELCRRGVTDVKTYDTDAVVERYGVPPARIPDWKGLVGDTSDNIPGVPGIGEKTATALLQVWESVENLLEHTGEVKAARARQSLEQNAEIARLSKHLATIVCDAPLELKIASYSPTADDWHNVRTAFEGMQFKSLLVRIPAAENTLFSEVPIEKPEPSSNNTDLQLVDIDGPEALESLKAALNSGEPVGIAGQIEGAGIDTILKAIAVSVSLGVSYTLRVKPPHIASNAGSLFDEEPEDSEYSIDGTELDGILQKAGTVACYGADPLLQSLMNAGAACTDIAFDVKVAGYLLDAGRSSYPLEDLAVKYGVDPAEQTRADAKPAIESALVRGLEAPMRARLKALDMTDLLEKVDMPLVSVLAKVERAGLTVDRTYLSKLSGRLATELEDLGKQIYGIAGEEFNIGSTKQLQTILFEKLKLPTGRKNKSGFTTGADLLEQLAEEHPIARKIIEYREISKLKSTYSDALVKLINPRTGRVHTTLNQTVASTGRLSSSDPNLQNIPIRSELGREIRRGFVAPKGRTLLSCDYSQIELRVLAHMAGDPALSEAFRNNVDVHSATAARVFGVEPNEVTSEQRRRAKTINFAVIYGQGAFALGSSLGVDTKTAAAWINEYFARMPGVKKFIAKTTADARANRYVSTLLGRRRYLPELDSPNHNMRQFAERAAVNMPIQGTAADIMKLAMIAVFNEVTQKYNKVCTMLLQVHDELLFEVDESALDEVVKMVKQLMENAYPLDVPLGADAKSGPNWADMKPCD